MKKELICKNFEDALRAEIIRVRNRRSSDHLYGDGNSFDFGTVIYDLEQNVESISEIELTEILHNVQVHY